MIIYSIAMKVCEELDGHKDLNEYLATVAHWYIIENV
jgi:hypothetical protein